MSQPIYFYDSKISGQFTTTWQAFNFGIKSRCMVSVCPEAINTDSIYFSFDGSTVEGRLDPGDSSFNMSGKRNSVIYIKSKSGSQDGRIWAY